MRRCEKALPAALATAVALAPVAAGAQSRPGNDGGRSRGTLNLVVENDRVANTDRHYTHGTYLSYTTRRGGVPDWAGGLAARLERVRLFGVGLFAGSVNRAGIAVGQTIFTPDDISARRLVRDDRPYAGHLYVGGKLVAEQKRGLQVLKLNAGVVGEAAQADDVQTIVHERIDVQRPNGWDHQLENEPTLNLVYGRKWRSIRRLDETGIETSVVPHVEAALGNVHTYAAAGFTAYFGQNLDADWGPPRIGPGLGGSGFFEADDRWHWSVFAGFETRLVARNIFLDGNSFEDSHRVDRKPLVGEIQFGVQLARDRWRLAFTQVVRSREFEEQDRIDRFGAVTLSVKF